MPPNNSSKPTPLQKQGAGASFPFGFQKTGSESSFERLRALRLVGSVQKQGSKSSFSWPIGALT